MTFLAPVALFGTLLLSIPIIVHLFKPRKTRPTPFSSLRWLKLTQQRLSRRVQWHQWLLFLLRAGCILLLVLALARPLAGMGGEGRATDRLVIVDGSRSMAYQVNELPSAWQRAQELAGSLLQKAGPGDRTALVLTGQPPRLLSPLIADATPLLASLAAAKPGQADTSLSAVLPLVRSLLPRQEERDIEVVFLTDNLKERWQQGDIQAFQKDLPRPVRVQVIDLGSASAQNDWIAGARHFKFGPEEDSWIRVEVGHVGAANHLRIVRLTGIAGLAEETQEVALNPGRMARVDFRIPAGADLTGQIADIRLEPADALPSDDRFFLNLDVAWKLRVLLVESEVPAADGKSVGLYLRTAIEVLTGSKQQAVELTTKTRATVAGQDFQQADVILLAGVAELSDSTLEHLENRVRAGTGLVVFLGPHLKPEFYNQKSHRSLQPDEGLFPLALKTGPGLVLAEGNPGRLTNLRWTHPLLAPLYDPVSSDLIQSHFRIFLSFAGAPGKNDTVLARFDDEVPALLERAVGAGRVIVLNTTANDEWSDLPSRRKDFVALVDRLLDYLAGGGLKRGFAVGAAITLPLSDPMAGSDLTVVSPSGGRLIPRLVQQRGQTVLHLHDVSEAGVYQVEGAGQKFTFVVNASRTDSTLSPMDRKILESWWAPTKLEFPNAEDVAQRLAARPSQWPFWPALIVMACLLFVAETVYSGRLCPRANPRAAAAVAVGPM